MKNRLLSLPGATALGLALMVASLPAHAAVSNGDFEEGLALWSVIGDADTTSAFGIGAISGSSALLLSTTSAELGGYSDPLPWSGTSAVDNATGELATFVGVSSGALDLGAGFEAYTGSAASQTFTVLAGQTLSFQWNLLTADIGMPDYAFVVLNGSATALASSTSAMLGTPVPELPLQTGWQSYSVTFTQNATLNLALGVVNVGDSTGATALLIDNVQITAVPEPTSVALMLGGLGLLALRARRRA